MKKKLRKVHIEGKEWIYYFTETFEVIIYSPDNKNRYVVNEHDIHGISKEEFISCYYVDSWDRPGWCNTLWLGPQVIKDYIINNIISKANG